MKKSFLLVCGTLFLSFSSLAQDMYLRVNGGYSLSASKTDFTENRVNSGPDNTTREALSGTYGRGAKFGLATGKMFNDNLALELGINYLSGAKATIGEFNTNGTFGSNQELLEAKAWALSLTPAIVMKGNSGSWNPYTRVGLVLPIGGRLLIESREDDFGTNGVKTLEETATREVRAKFNLGFKAAVGVTYPLSDKLSFFGEFELVSFTVAGKDAKLTEFRSEDFSTNTVIELSDLTTFQKESLFVEVLDDNSNSPDGRNIDFDKPQEELETFVNLSGLSLNVGLWFRL